MSEHEQPLPGGVRHGQTVREISGPWTPTVHALLEHLVAKGFPAPKPLGIDEKGREMFSYIDGEASIWPWPDVLRSASGLAHVGRTLRRYHDCVRDFVPPSPCAWQDFESRPPREDEIVCHGDFGPYNVIWKANEIAGVIDWEWAQPATPMRDIAQATWSFVPLRTDEDYRRMAFAATPAELRDRFLILLEAYGALDRDAVIEGVLALERERTERITDLGSRGIEPWKTFFEIGLHARNLRDRAWIESHRALLLA